MTDSAVTLLPQPDSPTMPSVSPARDIEAHAVDRARHAVGIEEMRPEIAHAEELLAQRRSHMRRARRGSRWSRNPSPTRLTASTTSASARPGQKIVQGARAR